MDVVHPSFLSLLFDNVCAYSHVEEFKVVFFLSHKSHVRIVLVYAKYYVGNIINILTLASCLSMWMS